jgi:Clp amino terminal domain, pathogenicity island component
MSQNENFSVDATLLSDGAARALRDAEASASDAPDGLVTSMHLLHALLRLRDRHASALLTSNNVNKDALYLEALKKCGATSGGLTRVGLAYADELNQLLETAVRAIAQLEQPQIDGATLLVVMVGRGKGTTFELLSHFGLTFEDAVQTLKLLQAIAQRVAEGESNDKREYPAGSPESPTPRAGRRIGSGRAGINENTGSARVTRHNIPQPPRRRETSNAMGPGHNIPQPPRPVPESPFAVPQTQSGRANRMTDRPPRPIDTGGMRGGGAPQQDYEAHDFPDATGVRGESQAAPDVRLGKLVENIPREMTAFVPVTVEARIGREESEALYRDLAGSGAVQGHDIYTTQAMTMQLRAPRGGFTIESRAPETQWIKNRLGITETDDFGSWRWSVTPTQRGSNTLQLVVAARTVDQSGLVAESPLPDQIIEIRVAINYVRQLGKVGGWGVAAIAGGVLARYGETAAGWLLSRL